MSKLLGTAKICGLTFKYYEATPDEEPDLEGRQGICSVDEAEIHVCEDMPKDVYLDTIVHESLHAIIGTSGLNHIIANAAGLKTTGKRFYNLEEEIVAVLTPHLIRFIATSSKITGKQ